MKKVIAVLLAGIIIVGNCGVALAIPPIIMAQNEVEITSADGEATRDVKGNYVSNNSATIYSVTIAWGNMVIDYKSTGGQTWNPGTHTYTGTSSGGSWVIRDQTTGSNGKYSGNKIEVRNDSNTAVTTGLSFAGNINKADATGPINGSFIDKDGQTITELALANADGGVIADMTKVAYLKLNDSDVPQAWSSETKLGTVTVNIQ